MKRRFEFVKGTSSKFWEIEVAGKEHVVRFGRIGAKGQESKKRFPSAGAATAAAEKLIAEKTKKGYREKGSAKSVPAKGKAGAGRKLEASPELLEAAQKGADAKVASLLASGADPNTSDKNGGTPLMWAARNGYAKIAKALLAAGADPNARMTSETKGSALGIAAKRGNGDVVELLLASGADVKMLGDDVLHRIHDAGNLEIICALGRAGLGDARVSKETCDRFGFLCETPREKQLLEALSWRVTAIKKKSGGIDVHFGKEVVECAPPFAGKAKAVPASYAAIARKMNGIQWESTGGGAIGFGGLEKGGHASSDWGWDSSYLSDGGNESFLRALKKAKSSPESLTPAFGCAQNWLVFDPTRKNKRGEEALAFVSHESCEWEPVKSADKLSYGGVLLRLLAQYFLGLDELEEISM